MKRNERAKMVLSMEFIMRCVSDEEVFEPWLMGGVADGDIEEGSLDVDDVDDMYLDDDTLADLMACFLRRMKSAVKEGTSGALYCDGVLSK